MEKISEADNYFEIGNFKQAMELYRQAIVQDPGCALAYQGLARCQARLGLNNDAVKTSHKALEIDSKLIIPYLILASIYYKENKWDDSLVESRKALELDPNSVLALSWCGVALVAKQKTEEAIASLERAVQQVKPDSPESVETHTILAHAYGRKGDKRKLIDELKIIYRLKPTIRNGILLFGTITSQYNLMITIIVLLSALLAFALRNKILLVIPVSHVFWSIFGVYLYASERNWRKAAFLLLFIGMWLGFMYLIYRQIS